MLLGANSYIHIEHKNLMFEPLQVQDVLCWWIYIEECSTAIHYMKGPDNVIADTFSHLYHQDDVAKTSLGKNDVPNVANEHNRENKVYYLTMDSPAMTECFLTLPDK